MVKIGRNQPCPCNSGLKYKKCCGSLERKRLFNTLKQDINHSLELHKAKQLTRQKQQGLSKGIISTDFNVNRVVAVGNQIYSSNRWKTFQDFLLFYIKHILGSDWGNAEIEKPFDDRHPIMQWYEKLCFYQRDIANEQGKVSSAPMTGFVEAYLQLSYNLYQLGHNTIKNEYNDKIQKFLIKRLKNVNQFAGAYYECYVFATIIKSGFEVDLVDETNGSSKHCDFVVTHKKSKKRYSVEVKAINRDGTYGAKHNTTKKTLKYSVRDQLYKALKKPSDYARIIFIETNQSGEDILSEKEWADDLASFVCGAEDLKISGHSTDPAFVIITNHSHQHDLNTTRTTRGAVPLGYKIKDFGYGKPFSSLRNMQEARNKYNDIMSIVDAIENHYDIPVTFDGELPSQFLSETDRSIIIGKTYLFDDIGKAKVTTASVDTNNKLIYIGTDTGHIITKKMTDAELYDYKKHPDTYFGIYLEQSKKVNDPYEFFEFLLKSYSKTPKEKLLEFMREASDFEQLKSLSQEDLAIEYCERLSRNFMNDQHKRNEHID